MPCPNMDAFFYIASQGDKIAFLDLRNVFKKRATILCIGILKKIGKFQGNPIDFEEILDDLFLKIVNEFDPTKGIFSTYSRCILEHKFSNYVFSAQNKINLSTYSLDDTNESGVSYLDMIQNRDIIPLGSDIAISNFKYEISSPNRHESSEDKVKKRILVLKYAGYNDREISEILNISISKYRRYVRESESLEYLSNFKLELK